jgi:GTPase SAR1 family protein
MQQQIEERDNFYKSNLIVNEVIVIGNAGVGKTNLIYVFDKGKKPLAANPTIGV